MKIQCLSVKKIFLMIGSGMLVSMLMAIAVGYYLFKDTSVLWLGTILMFCACCWMILLMLVFAKRLSAFTSDLCITLDNMMSGKEKPEQASDRETLFARIYYRLSRLYEIMQQNQCKVDEERQELQMLVSDISHQVKTPVSNLKMVTDTLLTRKVTEQERVEFLLGIRNQTDKLDFLVQALVKTSRLETGVIQLEKKEGMLFDTLAQAVGGIAYDAEKKDISVKVNCPEKLKLYHDSKWTAEALFNILENAVKYTPKGGQISVLVEKWEMYVKLDIADTGRGISESNQAAIFRRFYRGEGVHDEQGVGIGLYLSREIISKQGGYIKVSSEVGKGSTFSVFLPTN
jgi:signal transduction histidine kinase